MASSARDIQFRELKDTITELRTMVSEQTKLIASLKEMLKEKSEHEKVLQEQVDYLTKKLFGASSEKHADIPGQLSLFDEAEAEAAKGEPVQEEIVIKEHVRKKKCTDAEKYKGVKVVEDIYSLPEDQQICSVCGTRLEVVGKKLIRKKLEYIPAKVKVHEIYALIYGCPNCKQGKGDTEKPVFVQADVPEPLIPHSFASSSTVGWTMYQKFGNALPLYRQEKDWAEYGIHLSRSTLAHWIIYCSQNYLQPMWEYFHRELLKRSFAMADETRVQVLNEPGRRPQTQSFMWVFRSGEDGLPPIILYGYSPTRSGDNAVGFLDGFEGYLETDGYAGYNKVPNIKRCSCWAHIRRYFIDAVPKGKAFDYSQPAVQGVQYCNRLFDVEKKIDAKNLTPERRKELRLEKEKPILDAFWSWLDQQRPTRNSRMDKACNYARNRRQTV
jgi:transposase/uncharacterized coiled-coil protein SlyX